MLPDLLEYVLIGLLVGPLLPMPASDGGQTSCHQRMPCVVCHTQTPEAGAAGNQPLGLRTDVDERCNSCHGVAAMGSHPQGCPPAKPLLGQLPLDAEGRIACYTCHEPHGKGRSPHYLRRDDPTALCRVCHDDI